jgi:branched-chain amino acid transport system substrate-binding protein
VADAQNEGLSVVYQGSISLTAPDYTADCLQARNSGAQMLFIAADSNSIVRISQSCSRQGYKPVYSIPTGEDSMTAIPELEGSVSAAQSFPWFLRSGSPAIDEYAHALQQYAPNLLTNGYTSQSWGWISAKVFQEAATRGTAKLSPSDKATSQNVLSGLWSMKAYDVGGLDPGPMGRTFVQGSATPTTFCVFEAKIQGSRWVAPHGMTPLCR